MKNNPLSWIINKTIDKYKAWHKKYYSVEATCRREGYISWAAYECLLENTEHTREQR